MVFFLHLCTFFLSWKRGEHSCGIGVFLYILPYCTYSSLQHRHPLLTVPKCWCGHGTKSTFTSCIQMQVSKPEFCIMTYSFSFALYLWLQRTIYRQFLAYSYSFSNHLKLQWCWENAYMTIPWSSGHCSNPSATGLQSACLSAWLLIMTSQRARVTWSPFATSLLASNGEVLQKSVKLPC